MNQQHNHAKNIYLIILTIVTVLCIFIGIVIHLLTNLTEFDLFDWDEDDDTWATQGIEDEPLDAFKALDLDASVADVEIVYGSSYAISVDCPKRFMPTWEVDHDTLIIRQEDVNINKLHTNMNADFEITITIPSGTKLDSISATLNMGALEMDGISAAAVTIDADMGNVEISGIEADNIDITANMGNIELENGNITNITCDADMGNIELEGRFAKIEANCSMGSITIEGPHLDETKMDLDTDMGAIEINGKSLGSSYSN